MEDAVVRFRFLKYWTTLSNIKQDQNTCDLVFVCGDGKVSAHKLLIFHALPELHDMTCYACKDSHDEIVIHIPDIEMETMDFCLKELYTNRDSSMIRYVLNMNNVLQLKDENGSNDKNNFEKVMPKDTFEVVDTVELKENIFQWYAGNDIFGDDRNNLTTASSEKNPLLPTDLDDIDEIKQGSGDDPTFPRHELSDLVVGAVFENESVVKELVKMYNETNLVNLTIKSSSSKRLFYCCPCSRERKSESKGIRNRSVRYTGCPALFRFSKKRNGMLELNFIEESHNHAAKLAFPKGGSKIAFKWDSVADAFVRDGVIVGKNAEELREAMKHEGVTPLPTTKTVSLRMTKVKTMLGLDDELNQGNKKEPGELLKENL